MFDSLTWLTGAWLTEGWLAELSQFHFIRPLWLLAFLPMALLIWLRWREDNKPSWKDVLPAHLREALTIGERGWRKQLPLKLLMAIVSVAIVICAGPSWQREASPFGEDQASLLVVLDNSDSMLATDIAPSRLERAKHKIRDLLKARKGGRTGLAVYAGSAHVAMPITQDSKVFEPFLAAIEPQIMPIAGKQAEQALPLIKQQLSDQIGASVLLVSDGVNPTTVEAYQRFFAQSEHQLLILAAGNRNVVSNNPIDIDSLQNLASATGGKVVEISVDDSDIQQLNRMIERNMQLNGESSMPWKDMGYYLLIPMALVMLVWFRKGWLVQWCVSALLVAQLAFVPPVQAETVATKAEQVTVLETRSNWDKFAQWWWDLWLTPNQQGQRCFNQQEYLQAAKHFVDPLRKGTAYYYAGEYKLAHSAFLEMLNDPDPDVVNYGLYNAASALARQREYLAARELLQNLADDEQLHPALRTDVEHNLAVIAGIVEEINRTSESQAGTTDGPEESFELDDDKPRTADGADEETVAELMLKETLNANEILGSEELADKWLKRVEADPKYFLRAKFQIQLREASNLVSEPTAESEDKQ
ncbi:vWA domain-containing protein [Vibrio ponticus]|uniref:vWA domain-containing protein n=1 Tax=Vibrio ponticus TaxID=265668 RepID=UPI0009F98292|nr:VWA domain-containing protein [Vibrio ponticus]